MLGSVHIGQHGDNIVVAVFLNAAATCVDLLMADMFLSMFYHRLPLPLVYQVKQSVHT